MRGKRAMSGHYQFKCKKCKHLTLYKPDSKVKWCPLIKRDSLSIMLEDYDKICSNYEPMEKE